MTNTLRRVLGAVVLLGATSCIASASSISYYVDVFSGLTVGTLCPGGSPGIAGTCPTSATATYNNGTASNVSLTLPQFNQFGNANEGTPSASHIFVLSSVQLALDWKLLGNVNINNTQAYPTGSVPGGAPYNVSYDSAQAYANMTLTAGGTQVVGAGSASTGAGTVSCCNISNGDLIAGGTLTLYYGQNTFNGLVGTGANSQFAANLPFFQGFGANTISASVQTNAISASGTSSDLHSNLLSYGGSGQMGGIMTITYNYTETAIPEPGTMALMGGALIGVGCLARRKRNANR